MREMKDFEIDEIEHQIGNSLTKVAGLYALYSKHPENVRRYMFTMLMELKEITKKIEKIIHNENLMQD